MSFSKTPSKTPSTELVEATPADELVNPFTGELVKAVDLDALARNLRYLAQVRDQVFAVKADFERAVIEASKREGTRTLHASGATFIVSGDSELEWDLDELAKLLDAGLPPDRYNKLVTQQVTYKVNANVAKQLAGASDEYASIVKRAQSRIPKRQSVRLTERPGVTDGAGLGGFRP